MKYLKTRQDFLTGIVEYKENYQIKDKDWDESLLVQEVFQNEITWGGSLLGRLINSAIRKFKIGYNQVKISPLLKLLEKELDGLVANSLQGESFRKYNEFLIRSYIEEISDICSNNEIDERKLDELLGGHKDLWDDKDPKKNQRTKGLVQEALDVITDDLKDLKKMMGLGRDQLLDQLSDFNDDLRKLTVDVPTPPSQAGLSGFNLNFSHLLKGTINLINASYNFQSGRLLKYELFLEMQNQTEPSNQPQFKVGEVYLYKNRKVTITSVDGENVQADYVESGEPKEGKEYTYLNSKGQKYKVKILSLTIGGDKKQLEPGKVYVKQVVEPHKSFNVDKKNILVPKGLPFSVDDLKKLLKLPTDQPTNTSTPAQNTNTPTEEEINSFIDGLENRSEEDVKKDQKTKDLISKILNLINSKPEKAQSISVEWDEQQLKLKDAVEKAQKSVSISAEIKEGFIYEQNIGSQGSSGGQGSTASTPTKKKVKDVYNDYSGKGYIFSDVMVRLTQREADELKGLLDKGINNLRYEPEKRPDPIVAITRIYLQAHNLYFTEYIPSGRPGGRVSLKTRREYYKLGSTSQNKFEGEGAPDGPFAIKITFDKWKDGVLKILENQEYRKILSNITFIVPGAEDKFNPPQTNDSFKYLSNKSAVKLFERDGDLDIKEGEKSQGKILFEFMNDMLDKTRLDDFDKLQRILLAKYFGVQSPIKSNEVQQIKKQEPNPFDITPNTVYWNNHSGSISESGFYAIPIEEKEGHKLLFIQYISAKPVSGKNVIRVRFTFDDPKIMEKYVESNLSSYNFSEKWQINKNDKKHIYYGYIKGANSNSFNAGSGDRIKIVCANVNNDIIKEVYPWDFKVKFGTLKDFEAKTAKLFKNENKKQIQIDDVKSFTDAIYPPNEEKGFDKNINKKMESDSSKTLEKALEEAVASNF